MQQYIGTKIINAMSMTRLEYNKLRGWDLPSDENGADRGMLTEDIYGKKNTSSFDGYIQWITVEEFDRIYRTSGNLTFGDAIKYLKMGFKVARKGWNGKDMFLFLVPGSVFKVNRPPLLGIYEEGKEISYHAHIDMKTAQGDVVPWLASQTDMLAEDWMVV